MDESRADEPVALFGANQRRFREAMGWSQSELARRMQEIGWPKYSQVAVSRTEEGARAVRLDEAISLAALFGRKLQDLLDPKGVIDSWQRLRFLIEDYSDSVTKLRNVVRELEDERLFVGVAAKMLKEEVEAAGGLERVSETMVKTLSNADLILSRSTVDLVEGAIQAWQRDTGEDEGGDNGEHSEEA
ncbi:helix-turn-helix domain-containing protein [Arthrobacter sp. TB 26]|uniref:helix-turn-helix domain-containing protein n=1 Tax=Arthrobacter sp. TB 26 TaxID=494420 RepID=UPI000FE13E73|nr:helix-turn-helix transcriptional regulator [Arthrobacter sp. TB 26]